MTTLQTGFYRHFKGALYKVIGTATHSETQEKLVVYQPQYGQRDLWVRPLDMFLEKVMHEDEMVSRFTFVESPDSH